MSITGEPTGRYLTTGGLWTEAVHRRGTVRRLSGGASDGNRDEVFENSGNGREMI